MIFNKTIETINEANVYKKNYAKILKLYLNIRNFVENHITR